MLPLTLGIPCGAFLAGRWTYRTGASRRVIFTGLSLVLSMLGLMILIPVHAVKPLLFVMEFLGLGSGMVMVTSLVVAQSSVPAQFTGITTAVVALLSHRGFGSRGIDARRCTFHRTQGPSTE
jgi:MFS family permease